MYLNRLALFLVAAATGCCAPKELPEDMVDANDVARKHWQRWEAATGITPESVSWEAYYTGDPHPCGIEKPCSGAAWIGCPSAIIIVKRGHSPKVEESVFLHEIGHVLAESGQHLPTGVMSAEYNRYTVGKINLLAIQMVCAVQDCLWQRPEMY